jgi:type I protein arginine methyltransferase
MDDQKVMLLQAVPAELKAELTASKGPQMSGEHHSLPDRGAAVPSKQQDIENAREVDKAYSDSYSYFDIHREMLEDRVRTEAYRCAKM